MKEEKKNTVSPESSVSSPAVVDTSSKAKDGQNRCPYCGATEIFTNAKTGKLRCSYCRNEFEAEKLEGMVEDISQLQGQVMGSGASNIQADVKDVITLKCTSCGAEVVIDTASSVNAKCHWCRNILSINEQIPNGSVPDTVLPFGVTKDEARKCIEDFVGKRKFFANPKFTAEFTTENVMGVYFPYMLVDVNAHANLSGEGEHLKRRYFVNTNNGQKTYYDADLYHVEREYDLTISGLSVESSSDRRNNSASDKTNNVINAIMPFDIENCVKYNANFLKGYTSEKRDTNIDELRPLVYTQSKDISRFAANETLTHYDRGVKWETEDLAIKGQQWKSAYLPVWLYSYQEVNGEKKLLHYVAVNARTKETMGSVPIHMPKLLICSGLVELVGVLGVIFVDWDYKYVFLVLGFVFFFIFYAKYRNASARHTYETETKKNMTNLRQVDTFIKTKKGLENSRMTGANNLNVQGSTNNSGFLGNLTKNTVVNAIADSNPVASIVKEGIENRKKGE